MSSNLTLTLSRSPPLRSPPPLSTNLVNRKWRPPTPRYATFASLNRSVSIDTDIPEVPRLSFWDPDTPSDEDAGSIGSPRSLDLIDMDAVYSPSVYGDSGLLSPTTVPGFGVLPSPATGLLSSRRASDVGFACSPRFMFPRTPPAPPTKTNRGNQEGNEANDGEELEQVDPRMVNIDDGENVTSKTADPEKTLKERALLLIEEEKEIICRFSAVTTSSAQSSRDSSAPSLTSSADTLSTAPSSVSSHSEADLPNVPEQFPSHTTGLRRAQTTRTMRCKRSIVDLRLNAGPGGQLGWSHTQSPVTLYFKSKEVDRKETIRERRWKASFG